jgi:hypothetical protein
VPPIERFEVTEETKLVELCVGRHELLQGAFTLPGGVSMIVDDLKGYTMEELMAFVKRESGPHGLVPGWLEENQLWRFLRGYVSPITKKAKSGEGSGSSSSASPGKWLS